MQRRKYLKLAGVLGCASFSGCSNADKEGESGPIEGSGSNGTLDGKKKVAVSGPEKPSPRYDLQNTGYVSDFSVVPDEMEIEWAVGADDNPANNSTIESSNSSSVSFTNIYQDITLSNGHIFAAGHTDGTDPTGQIYAINAVNGDISWKYTNDDIPVSAPIINDETVYISFKRELVAIDIKTGKKRWSKSVKVGEGTFGEPIVSRGYVLVAVSGELHSYQVDTGDREWKVDGIHREIGSPAVGGERIFLPGPAVYAINIENGEKEWSEGVEHIVDTPIVAGEKNVFFGHQDEYYSLDKDSGEKNRVIEAGKSWPDVGDAKTSPVVANGSIILNHKNQISGVNPTTGSVKWTLEDISYDGIPTVSGDKLYLIRNPKLGNSKIIIIDINKGQLMGKYDITNYNSEFKDYRIENIAGAVFSGDKLFLMTSAGGTDPVQQLVSFKNSGNS